MSTATMNISLPDSLKEYVKERMEEEHYGNASDYIRSLIREDQKRRDEKKLEQMLLEGVRSGPGMEIGSKEWEKFWEGIRARLQEKTKTHMRKVLLKRKAEEDVREITLYIAEDNPEAAEAFRLALESVRETLADLPEIGSVRNFDNPELEGLRM